MLYILLCHFLTSLSSIASLAACFAFLLEGDCAPAGSAAEAGAAAARLRGLAVFGPPTRAKKIICQ